MKLLICCFVILGSTPLIAADNENAGRLQLHERLAVFQPMLDKTFRGEFAKSTPDKPMFDISRWERALNGQAIRVLHSVNDGEYGGETIIMWDREQEKLVFWYFTTAGFRTQGTMEVDGDKWTSTESVTGNGNGVTQVKAVSELASSGILIVRSEYLQNGQWVKGHEIKYQPVANAVVKFK